MSHEQIDSSYIGVHRNAEYLPAGDLSTHPLDPIPADGFQRNDSELRGTPTQSLYPTRERLVRGLALVAKVEEKGNYIFFVILVISGIVLGLTSFAIYGADHSEHQEYGDRYLYSAFHELKLLLATSVLTFFAAFYLWSVRDESPYAWALKLQIRYQLTSAIFGHFIPLVLWFSGAIALAAWAGKGVWCSTVTGYCTSLTSSSKAIDAFLVVFGFTETLLLVIPTLMAFATSFDEYSKAREIRDFAARTRANTV